MTLTTNKRVVFYDFPHSYILDGEKTLIGVTTLMKKHGLSADYSRIDDATLQHAAELGTLAHETIENYIEGLPTPDIPLIKSFKKLGLDIIATEYLISDNKTVASSIDLVRKVDEETVDIIDMKRTSSVHKEALAWQTGIYKYLFLLANPTLKVRNCYCLPIKKGNKDDILADKCGSLVEITPVSEDKVKALLQAELLGKLYAEADTIAPKLELADEFIGNNYPMIAPALAHLGELEKQMAEVKTIVDAAKQEIYYFMLSENIDSYEGFGMKITLKKPYTKESVDTTTLKKKYPDIAEEVTKTSEVRGNVTIKLL